MPNVFNFYTLHTSSVCIYTMSLSRILHYVLSWILYGDIFEGVALQSLILLDHWKGEQFFMLRECMRKLPKNLPELRFKVHVYADKLCCVIHAQSVWRVSFSIPAALYAILRDQTHNTDCMWGYP